MRPPTNILEPGGRRKLALVQGTTTVASLAGPFFIRTHTGTGQDISVIGWAMTVLLKRGEGQTKKGSKERGRGNGSPDVMYEKRIHRRRKAQAWLYEHVIPVLGQIPRQLT